MSVQPFIVSLIGPGGAGKSTTGALVAAKLGCRFVDLDEHFLRNTGNIGDYIDEIGYEDYARQNVANFLSIKQSLNSDAVIALSSGFMLYPDHVHPSYVAAREELEQSPSTFVLMAGFDVEACVRTTVERQLSKPHHSGNAEGEELSIRKRFPLYMALRCKKLSTLESPEHVASKVTKIVLSRNRRVPSHRWLTGHLL